MRKRINKNPYLNLINESYLSNLAENDKNIDLKLIEYTIEKILDSSKNQKRSKAIRLYFNISKSEDGKYCKTQQEVGKEILNSKTLKYGVSSTRIQQLIQSGKRHLVLSIYRHHKDFHNYLKSLGI